MRKFTLLITLLLATNLLATSGQIMDANDTNNAYYIVTPFTTNDLFNIQYAQADNQMYLVDGNHPPQLLRRFGHADWTIEDCNFITGPYLPENIEDISITPSAITGTITLTADSNIFDGNHVGSLWQIS